MDLNKRSPHRTRDYLILGTLERVGVEKIFLGKNLHFFFIFFLLGSEVCLTPIS
jgi:hypothetical protein